MEATRLNGPLSLLAPVPVQLLSGAQVYTLYVGHCKLDFYSFVVQTYVAQFVDGGKHKSSQSVQFLAQIKPDKTRGKYFDLGCIKFI